MDLFYCGEDSFDSDDYRSPSPFVAGKKEKTIWRFRTYEEMPKDSDGAIAVGYGWNSGMDCFFGKPVPKGIEFDKRIDLWIKEDTLYLEQVKGSNYTGEWLVGRDMTIEETVFV